MKGMRCFRFRSRVPKYNHKLRRLNSSNSQAIQRTGDVATTAGSFKFTCALWIRWSSQLWTTCVLEIIGHFLSFLIESRRIMISTVSSATWTCFKLTKYSNTLMVYKALWRSLIHNLLIWGFSRNPRCATIETQGGFIWGINIKYRQTQRSTVLQRTDTGTSIVTLQLFCTDKSKSVLGPTHLCINVCIAHVAHMLYMCASVTTPCTHLIPLFVLVYHLQPWPSSPIFPIQSNLHTSRPVACQLFFCYYGCFFFCSHPFSLHPFILSPISSWLCVSAQSQMGNEDSNWKCKHLLAWNMDWQWLKWLKIIFNAMLELLLKQ